MNIYLGIDLGTSVIKGLAIDDNGKVLASVAKESPIISRQPDWAEQSPEAWWNNVLEILYLLGTKIQAKNVHGIGLSGQMHGLVCYDRLNKPLRRAIVWLDTRSNKEVERVNALISPRKIYRITGNPLFTGFLLPSLLWVKRNEPDLYKKIALVSSPKDYVAYRLTGNLRTEPTDALATGAFDHQKNTWSEEILKCIGIHPSLFPEVKDTRCPYGGITKKIAKISGIPEGTPVFGASDQSMAAMGSGLIHEGQAMIAISTGGQCLVITKKGTLDAKQRLHTLNHALPAISLSMAATLSAGLSLRWFKNDIAHVLEMPYERFIDKVENIAIGSNGLFFLPYLAGERTPHFNTGLRGGFIGLSISHSRLFLIRAIMEGVAYSIRDCLDVFKQLNIPLNKIILSGGGAKSTLWRKIITDTINMPTETITIEDHSPFGAAVFSRFAQEGFDTLSSFYERVIQSSDSLYPNEKNVEQYDTLFTCYKNHARYLNETYR